MPTEHTFGIGGPQIGSYRLEVFTGESERGQISERGPLRDSKPVRCAPRGAPPPLAAVWSSSSVSRILAAITCLCAERRLEQPEVAPRCMEAQLLGARRPINLGGTADGATRC
jgi:hypothetical protein